MTAVALEATPELLLPDADTFEALVLLTAGGRPGPREAETLEGLGAARDGEATDELGAVLAPVRAPVCQFRLVLSGPHRQVLHQGWLDGRTTTVLTQGEEDECLLRWAPTSCATTVLAHLVGLGPRRLRVDRPRPLRSHADLWDADPEARCLAASMAAEDAGPLRDGLVDDRWSAWELELGWPDPAGELRLRTLAVLDTPLALARLEDGVLHPCTASELWRLLQRILPADADLSPAVLAADRARGELA